MRPVNIIAISPYDVPAGAVGMCVKQGALGRLIARRQGGIPYSHVVLATGRGEMVHAPWRWVAHEPITRRWPRREIDWWAPRRPLTDEEARQLRAIAHTIHDRITYSWWAIASFVLLGYPTRRGHGVYCSYLVAELWRVLRDYDFSGVGRTWQVAPREILARLNARIGYWTYIGTTGIAGRHYQATQ